MKYAKKINFFCIYGKKAVLLHTKTGYMKRIVTVMSILSLLSTWSCAHQGGDISDTHITSFYYSYDGTIGGNSHRYEIKVADGVATIKVEDMLHRDYGDMYDTVDAAFMDSLERLCAKHKVNRWDGYDKYNPHVCDGHGFSMSVHYDNGKSMHAHGMNMSPSGFWDFDREMHELFAPVCERMREKARQQKIAEGVSGNLTFIMVTMLQRGAAGSDKYEVQICRQSIRETNFHVSVQSRSGEFFPAGTYYYAEEIADEKIDWKAFAKLVDKHHLTQWMDFEKSVEDYNNSEWFQLDLSYENGHIHAMGSAHPEGYEAFRKDFLKLLAKTIDNLKIIQK